MEEEAIEQEVRYLVYTLGKEQYASSLLDVLEVIKVGRMKPVPHANEHFVGVANLHGQIISVIDLRIRFGVDPDPEAPGLVLVVPFEEKTFGFIVDDVLAVDRLPEEDLRYDFAVETTVPIEYLTAVTTKNDRLISIVDFNKVLSKADLLDIANNSQQTINPIQNISPNQENKEI